MSILRTLTQVPQSMNLFDFQFSFPLHLFVSRFEAKWLNDRILHSFTSCRVKRSRRRVALGRPHAAVRLRSRKLKYVLKTKNIKITFDLWRRQL